MSLLCLSIIHPSLAQKKNLSQQSIPEVISTTTCRDILEDQYGFLWFGGEGLKKYNGYNSKNYQANVDSISLGDVYALLEDRNGIIWIGTSTGLFQYHRTTDEVVPKFFNQLKNKRGVNSKIASLFEDSKGRIWLGGDDNLFVINNLSKLEIKTIIGLDIEPTNQFFTGIHCIRENKEGKIFAGTTIGLWEIKEDFSIKLFQPADYKDNSKKFRIIDIEIGEQDTIWMAGVAGLWTFETKSHKLSKYEIPDIQLESTRDIFIDKKKQIWLADPNDIYLRSSEGAFKKHPFSSQSHTVSTREIFKDRFGNIIIATSFNVLKYESAYHEMLPFFQIQNDFENNDNFFFRSMQDSLGGFWFRMLKSGLGYCSGLGEEFKILLKPPLNSFNGEIKNFCTDGDNNVWVITLTNGLYLFPKGKENYQHFELKDSILEAVPLEVISDNHNDSLLWISNKNGLCRVNRFTHEEKWFNPSKDISNLGRNLIGTIEQDDDGEIWFFLTHENNRRLLSYFDTKKNQFHTLSKPDDEFDFGGGRTIKRVAPNIIWRGTRKGLIIINTKAKTFEFFNEKNGLPVNQVMSVVPEGNGNIWFTSPQSFCKYDGKKFECFKSNPQIGSFVYHSATRLNDGRILLGGTKGLFIFHPEKIKKDSIIPQLYLTNFEVHDQNRKFGKAYELINKIQLPFEDNSVTFEFSGFHFSRQNQVQYQHQLIGFQEDWIKTPSSRKVYYNNLSSGTYTFKVKAANPDDFWTDENDFLEIHLTILYPWYRTNLAWFIWISSFLGIIYFFYYFQLNRRLAEAEANRLKELDLAKSQLYTNITHEFRTPLTIILGMAEQVKNDPKNWFNEGLELIRRNGKQLLNLVNQMLDLSKLESGNMQLKLINGDIVSFLNYLVESFHSYVDSKDIRLHFASDFKEFFMDYDPEKMQNMISNLLSNGIKFTPTGGDIYLDIRAIPNEEKTILLQIRDNGIGIAEEHLPFIFDRFYQADSTTTRRSEGTGIGLALTKQLVKLMGGEIKVESEINQGTKFSILLPVTENAKKSDSLKLATTPSQIGATVLLENKITEVNLDDTHVKSPLVLLIEDNQDVITYLSSFLSAEYQIETATNGQLGIDKAIELIPDLIVSDVMMPEKDGFEVCSTLKKDERTSHIPIILLTAKSDQSAKIEGLAHGADAYLAKPFNKEELLIRIEKLIELRNQMSLHFQNSNLLEVIEKKQPTFEDVFLQKLIQIVEDNLSDEHFGLPELCKKAGLSRSQLFRKLKALTGKSTTKFIRTIRLEKGKILLETTDLTIAEIAFQVGFTNPNYFTRTFQETYGGSPSSFRNP